MKWFIVGYYVDNKGSWTMWQDDNGKTKTTKGI